MKKYSEVNDQVPFNFDYHLNLPDDNFNPFQLKVMRIKSESWCTCAVGNQCRVIPRWHTGCPKDDELNILGTNFMNQIQAMEEDFKEKNMVLFSLNKHLAIRTLELIEKRSAYLIEQILTRRAKRKMLFIRAKLRIHGSF